MNGILKTKIQHKR